MKIDVFINGTIMLLQAVPLTISLVSISLILGAVLALFLTMMQLSKNKLSNMISKGYVLYFRGTPLLVQMYLLYFGVGFWITGSDILLYPIIGAILSEPYWYAIMALTFNTAGYTTEILRGAISSVDTGQTEAGLAVGIKRSAVFRRIVLPQATRNALPAYTNEIILMIKGSSLASTITLMEITGTMVRLRSETYAVYEFVVIAGAIYLLMNYFVTVGMGKLEKKLELPS